MQLTKIELKNFRQYINEEIIFSNDAYKNVTLIIGDGGSGKTTLSQAFTWVLYEQVEFKNKVLLNSQTAKNMPRGAKNQTKVTLHFNYLGESYILSRCVNYVKTNMDKVRADGEAIVKLYIIRDGNQEPLSDLERFSTIRKMLPVDLSRYFFFDGEKIEKMSKEIQSGKSPEFANAVQGLLGLSALQILKKHISPHESNSVYKYYDSKIEEESDVEVKLLRKNIEEDNEKINQHEAEILQYKDSINQYKEKIDKINNDLSKHKDTENIQNECRRLDKIIAEGNSRKSTKTKALLDNFHTENTLDFMSKNLMKYSLEELKDSNKIDKGIPDIQARTIDYLIKMKKCLCGNCISEGSPEYETLLDLKEYIPPKSVGGAISELAKDLRQKIASSNYFFINMQNYVKDIREADISIKEAKMQRDLIDDSLINSSNNIIRELKLRQKDYNQKIIDFQELINKSHTQIGILTERINRNSTKRNDLIAKTNNNKIFSVYRTYTKAIFDMVNDTFAEKENSMREIFEKTINDIFVEIYGIGISMTIDAGYNINVQVEEIKESEDDLDHSTSQNYSVIFAFIAAVMKLIKEKKGILDNEDNALSFEENYPLVMDAPLSAFDKTRIKNLCNILPQISEQVIVFIKDTDGDIAREHMEDRIGKSYIIEMNGLLNSKIIPEVM